jgi:hypothetical protein
MGFIINSDYDTHIERETLLGMVEEQGEVLDQAERAAVEQVRSALAGRYDMQAAFSVPELWKSGTTYVEETRARTADGFYIATEDSTGVEPGVTAGWESSWRLDDPRNVLLVELVMRLALCRVVRRVVPAKLPEIMGDDCKQAADDLKALRDGLNTIDLPQKPAEETQFGGMKISSQPKINWGY